MWGEDINATICWLRNHSAPEWLAQTQYLHLHNHNPLLNSSSLTSVSGNKIKTLITALLLDLTSKSCITRTEGAKTEPLSIFEGFNKPRITQALPLQNPLSEA